MKQALQTQRTIKEREERIMQKKFKIEVDCANCAAKMEEAVRKIDGVTKVSVSFMAQKMVVEADDSRFDSIMKDVVKACKKVEPDCEVYL